MQHGYWRLIGITTLVASAVIAVVKFGTLDPLMLRAAIGQSALSPVVFLLLHIPASLFFLPRSIIAIAAGFVFGPWVGFWLALAGAVIGGTAGFCLARVFNDGVVKVDPASRMAPLLQRAARGGWLSVMLFRLIPGIHHSLANYLLGVAPISLMSFVIGSAIAQTPSTAIYMYAAWQSEAILTEGSSTSLWTFASLAFCLSAVGVLLVVRSRLLARHKAHAGDGTAA
jgi:uncharacterized membrane protein YdjX (TVP38/TMEM64 family)